MKRWHSAKRKNVTNHRIDAFLDDVVAVYKKHGLSISHEDGQGAFIIEPFSELKVLWLRHSYDGTTEG